VLVSPWPDREGNKLMFLSEWREFNFGVLPCRKKRNLMTARVSMLLKSRASLTWFRVCFLSSRAKDLSAPRYSFVWVIPRRLNFMCQSFVTRCLLIFTEMSKILNSEMHETDNNKLQYQVLRYNEDLNDLYSSPNIVRVIKSRRMRWTGHVARMG